MLVRPRKHFRQPLFVVLRDLGHAHRVQIDPCISCEALRLGGLTPAAAYVPSPARRPAHRDPTFLAKTRKAVSPQTRPGNPGASRPTPAGRVPPKTIPKAREFS